VSPLGGLTHRGALTGEVGTSLPNGLLDGGHQARYNDRKEDKTPSEKN
jgi:hypothetical protein